MTQSASEAGGLAWGWDGDADEDWEGAALTLLALAVVAATALALHWFGSTQDQEAAGPASTAPWPLQVGAAGPALPLKHKVSGAVEGHGSGRGKPGPPGRGQGSPAAAGAQDQEPLGGGDLVAAASTSLKTQAGEGAGGGAVGRQRGNAALETLRRKGQEARRSGSALPSGGKAEGSSAPLLIHFTPRGPGREVEVQGEAGGVRGKVPVHRVGRDSRPWQQGPGSPASRGQSPGSRWGQVDSGQSGCRRPKLDALSLGSVVSVWDAVGAASSLPAGSEGLLFPQELPPLCSLQTRPLMGVSERGLGKSSPQAARGLALDSGATASENEEAATLAPRESQGSPASMEGWPWVRREVLVTGSFSQAPGPVSLSPEGPQGGRPPLSLVKGTTEACTVGQAGANGSGDHAFSSSGPGGTKEQGGHGIREGRGSLRGQAPCGSADVCSCISSLSPSATTPPCTPKPPPPPGSPPAAHACPGLLPGAPVPPIPSPSDSLPLGVSQSPAAGSSSPAPTPAPLTGAPPAAPSAAPTAAAAPAPASASRLASQEPSVVLCKDHQQGQLSTSWGNLISMVLRSHPFPRPEKPQGRAPRATLKGPSHPGASSPSENRKSAAPPEEERHGAEGLATRAGPGGLEEAGARPQQSRAETEGAAAASPPLGPRGERTKEKHPDPLLQGATEPTAPSPPEQTQPGSSPSLATGREPQPVPRPRKRSLCEMSQSPKQEAGGAAPGQHQGQATGAASRPSGRGQGLAEKHEEARKLTVFLQRPGGWRVAEGPRKSRASVVALPRWLDLGSCLEALAFAQQHEDPGLAQETYAWMSDNLLHVLRDPSLYRQLSGADRERIVSLRTGRGPAVLGALVLPGLYGASRSGLTRDSPAAEALAVGPAAPPPPAYLHVFHPRENAWRPLTEVPQEAPLRGCGLCTLHNYLFLAGGIRGSGAEAVCSNEVFCYNPLTNIWSQVRPMRQARAQLKLVALDGLLYAIGGECLHSMESYDPRADAWTSRAPLPAGTFPVAHEAVACQGDIYVTGGHLFYRLLRYSPLKDAWDECPYSASHRRSSDMVALGGFLYRFDLLRGVGAAVMRYNTVTGSWSRAASLPLPAPAPLRCAVLGNTIYCLNHQVTATFTVSEGTAQFQAKELQPFPLGTKGVLCPFTLTLPAVGPLQTAL
ncbi:kelch domain-containing protein 7B [Dama dama]|uniref:kelch domain-containing protein 7B n=1 Tax=Dama dama TaxID=30532 RepID=UPI002A36845B|nr:kelch domain-containing protein 7B [Dama dama]